jgi:hypothetical protein
LIKCEKYGIIYKIVLDRSMNMDIPMTDKNEIKIFILYLMERIGYPVMFSDV